MYSCSFKKSLAMRKILLLTTFLFAQSFINKTIAQIDSAQWMQFSNPSEIFSTLKKDSIYWVVAKNGIGTTNVAGEELSWNLLDDFSGYASTLTNHGFLVGMEFMHDGTPMAYTADFQFFTYDGAVWSEFAFPDSLQQAQLGVNFLTYGTRGKQGSMYFSSLYGLITLDTSSNWSYLSSNNIQDLEEINTYISQIYMLQPDSIGNLFLLGSHIMAMKPDGSFKAIAEGLATIFDCLSPQCIEMLYDRSAIWYVDSTIYFITDFGHDPNSQYISIDQNFEVTNMTDTFYYYPDLVFVNSNIHPSPLFFAESGQFYTMNGPDKVIISDTIYANPESHFWHDEHGIFGFKIDNLVIWPPTGGSESFEFFNEFPGSYQYQIASHSVDKIAFANSNNNFGIRVCFFDYSTMQFGAPLTIPIDFSPQVYADPQERLWIFNSLGALFQLDAEAETWIDYTEVFGTDTLIASTGFTKVTVWENDIWKVMPGKLLHYDGGVLDSFDVTNAPIGGINYMQAIARPNGGLLIQQGSFFYFYKDNLWSSVPVSTIFDQNNITSWDISPSGNIYILAGHQLMHLGLSNSWTLITDTLTTSYVTLEAVSDDKLVLSSNAKIFEINNLATIHFDKNNSLFFAPNQIYPSACQVDARGTYWRTPKSNLRVAYSPSYFIVSSKENIAQNNLLSIYPNPPNDATTLHFSAQKADTYRLICYDMMGNLIHKEEIEVVPGENEKALDMSNWPSGIYPIVLHTSRGEMLQAKAVKQ
jgi:Secretion system C-terminal sorting domain